MSEPTAAASAGQPCILVIGMHRSGTSATTASLAALGVDTLNEANQIAASHWNERGNYESRALKDVNDRLLYSLGGTWSGPPELTPGWEADRSQEIRRAKAARTFVKYFPTRPMVWKDPRNCITLPFWRTVIDPPLAAVFVVRDPQEVARSLVARDGVTLTYGLALWDRYVRSASTNLAGLPTLVGDYARIVDDPTTWLRDLVTFLREIGATFHSASEPDTTWLASDLRRQDATVGERSPLAAAPSQVFEILRQRSGFHPVWRPPDLGAEPPWVDDVLHLRRQADALRHELNQAHQVARTSKIFRITRYLGELRR